MSSWGDSSLNIQNRKEYTRDKFARYFSDAPLSEAAQLASICNGVKALTAVLNEWSVKGEYNCDEGTEDDQNYLMSRIIDLTRCLSTNFKTLQGYQKTPKTLLGNPTAIRRMIADNQQ